MIIIWAFSFWSNNIYADVSYCLQFVCVDCRAGPYTRKKRTTERDRKRLSFR